MNLNPMMMSMNNNMNLMNNNNLMPKIPMNPMMMPHIPTPKMISFSKFIYNDNLNNNKEDKNFFFNDYEDNYNIEGDKEFIDDFLMDKMEGKDDLDNKKKKKKKF